MHERYRDRWERWLRTELASLQLPEDVSTAEVWAVASMLATYGDADGTEVKVSIETIRRQLRIGKPKARIIADWLDETGLLVVVTKHGRDTATRRALAIPGQCGPSDDGTTCGPVNSDDDGTTCGPIKPPMTGPKTAMTGPGTTNDGTERAYDGTALRSQTTDQEATRGDHARTRAREAPGPPPPTPQPPGPEPHRRCPEHLDWRGKVPPCGDCREARLEHEHWQSETERWDQARREAIRACPDCHGTGNREDDEGRPIKCDHREVFSHAS